MLVTPMTAGNGPGLNSGMTRRTGAAEGASNRAVSASSCQVSALGTVPTPDAKTPITTGDVNAEVRMSTAARIDPCATGCSATFTSQNARGGSDAGQSWDTLSVASLARGGATATDWRVDGLLKRMDCVAERTPTPTCPNSRLMGHTRSAVSGAFSRATDPRKAATSARSTSDNADPR